MGSFFFRLTLSCKSDWKIASKLAVSIMTTW